MALPGTEARHYNQRSHLGGIAPRARALVVGEKSANNAYRAYNGS